MSNDALLALLAGPRPVNAASFMDPFPSYDLAGLISRGLTRLMVGNRMIVGGGGYANQFTDIATGAPGLYQPTGQTGTLTKKTDSYLGGGPTRPSIEWSDDTDLKALHTANFLPPTGEWWKFGSMTPLRTQCNVFGQSDTSKARMTIVNAQIRGQIASSGSGGFSVNATPDGANLVNRSFGYFWGRRGSDNTLVIGHHLAGVNDGSGNAIWTEVAASQPATTGASGTGSSLTINADVIEGNWTVTAGYSAYARRQVDGWWVGTLSSGDKTTLRQIIDYYSGL